MATDAIQVFGGYGYTKEFPVEKHYRDANSARLGGTSEIQRTIISRGLIRNGAQS